MNALGRPTEERVNPGRRDRAARTVANGLEVETAGKQLRLVLVLHPRPGSVIEVDLSKPEVEALREACSAWLNEQAYRDLIRGTDK